MMPTDFDIKPKPCDPLPVPPLKGKLEETPLPVMPENMKLGFKDYYQIAKGYTEQWALQKLGLEPKPMSNWLYAIATTILAIILAIVSKNGSSTKKI